MTRLGAALATLTALVIGLASCGSGLSVDAGSADGMTGRGIDGTWVLRDLVDGGRSVELPDGLELRIDGDRIQGQSACNSFGGSVDVRSNGTLTVTDLAQTEMACVDADRMALESVHSNAVATAADWSTGGPEAAPTDLTLTNPSGRVTYTRAVPPPALPLIGTVWTLDTIYTGTGASAAASSTDQASPEATIEIADGALTLRSGDCATTTPVTKSDGPAGSLSIGPFEPIDGCSANYDVAIANLAETTGFTIVESQLTLRAADRDLIGFRSR